MQSPGWSSVQTVIQYHLCSSDRSSSAAEVVAHYHDAGVDHASGSPDASQRMALCGDGLVHPGERMNYRQCTWYEAHNVCDMPHT